MRAKTASGWDAIGGSAIADRRQRDAGAGGREKEPRDRSGAVIISRGPRAPYVPEASKRWPRGRLIAASCTQVHMLAALLRAELLCRNSKWRHSGGGESAGARWARSSTVQARTRSQLAAGRRGALVLPTERARVSAAASAAPVRLRRRLPDHGRLRWAARGRRPRRADRHSTSLRVDTASQTAASSCYGVDELYGAVFRLPGGLSDVHPSPSLPPAITPGLATCCIHERCNARRILRDANTEGGAG